MIRFYKYCSILILIGFVFGSSCTNINEKRAQSFRFVFMTDIHVQPELAAEEGFKQAIDKVNSLSPKPDFVITGGDLIMDALKQNYERADSLYTLYDDLCKNFAMPVYHCIGNHELFGLFEESGINADHPEYAKNMFRNRIGQGKTYRSFDHKGWHFILLDGVGITDTRGYTGHIDEEQLAWLKPDLEKLDNNTPIVVALHMPIVSFYLQLEKGTMQTFRHSTVLTNSKEVMNVFKNYKLRLALQGHWHVVEEMISRNTHFITGGSVCGAWWEGPYQGFDEGFVVVDIHGNDFNWFYQTFGWDVKKLK